MTKLVWIVVWLLCAGPARAERPPPVSPPIVTTDQFSRDAAVIIGNEAYQALPQVVYANRDARAVTEWLRKTRGISRYRTKMLENATRSEIERAVQRTARRVKSRGTLWIYYAGHGTHISEDAGRGLLGIEASPLSPADSAASLEALVDSVRAARRAWRIVLIIDSGFGNVGRDGLEVIPGKAEPDVGALPDFGPGVIVWLAESGAGGALAYPSAQHGLFTYLVLGSTRGWADGVLYDDPDGQVSLLEAQTYVDQVAQRLGRVTHPAIDLRAEENNWPLVQGSNLEAGPDFATARRLSLEDRQNRFAAREEMIKAEASAFWAETLQLVQEGGPDGQIALEGFIAEYERARIEIEWAVSLPELERAREMLIHYSDSSSDMVSMSASDILPSCDDLISLEQSAFVGEFSEPQITCLENRMRTERLQTVRSDISRLLLVNAQSAGNVPVWEELMARHLEEIDRSDPDLCFSYAVHLYRSSLDNQEESIRWSNYALENKHVWEGEAFIKNVSNLYKLRAEAASKLWQDAEKQHIASPSSESTALARDFRGLAMDYSREWLDYMRAASLPEERAYNMCVAAAGTADFCQSQ